MKPAFATLALLAALVAGCGKGNGTGTGATRPLHLAFVTNNASDFWTVARKGTEKAQGDLKAVTVDCIVPSEPTVAEQRRIIDDLLVTGVDGIAMSPVDPVNETSLINETAKQTLVFTQDSDAPNSQRVCYIGTDNVAAGRQAGELMKEALPAGGGIMLFVGSMDVQNAKERLEGIKEALDGSKLQILGVETDNADHLRAKANVTEALAKVPDVAGLLGLWSYNGPAILSAVKDAGKAGKVKIVCFDAEDETLAGVKDGAIFATVAQQPFEFGRLAITVMANYLRGDKAAVPASGKIIVPSLAIDKGKIDAFILQMNELRGRQAPPH